MLTMPGAVVLGGGRGDRIGGFKPLIELAGRSLISYVVEAAMKVSDEVVVVVGRDEEAVAIRDIISSSVKVVVDVIPGRGPMVGFCSGLRHLRSEYAAALPCDSPLLNAEALRYLFGRGEGADAAIPIWPNGYIEPLHGVYRVSAALEGCEAAVGGGELRMSSMIGRLEEVIYVPVEDLKRYDPELLTFLNINDREDLVAAEAVLRSRGQPES